MGTKKRPVFRFPKLFEEFETVTRQKSAAYRPISFAFGATDVKVVGDKPVSELTVDDAIDYSEWFRFLRTRSVDHVAGRAQ